ncbi:unnamed protein product, partial [Mesorhabditis belari]|uniref:glucuronosyltransferase n=1 Tax=Mesorhabditis belari TaxID=2138241 RepID=A0AAF3EPQ5_9BILA
MRIFLLLAFLHYAFSIKILMFNPGFGHSHMRFMGGIADILIEAGHEITEIRSTLEWDLRWEGISKTKEIFEYPMDEKVAELMASTKTDKGFMAMLWDQDMSPAKLSTMAHNMTLMFSRACENLVFETDLMSKLKDRHFDLGISEAFDDCGHGIFEAIGLKTVVTTSSSNIMDHQSIIFGVPRVPSYVPGSMSDTSEKMSISERLSNAISSHFGANFFLQICDSQSEIFKKHLGKDFPTLREIMARSALLFTNTQPFIDFPKPTLYKVVDIGGIHIREKKVAALDKEWDTILGKRRKPYCCPVRSMPDVQFIWKYEIDDLASENLPENLHLSKWTPQTALLADQRLSLFVTHGGLCSTIEIAYSGTPSLVIPLFADQSRNAQVLMRQKIAQKYSKFEIKDGKKLAQAIKEMLDESSYKSNAITLSNLLQSVPFKPKELLLRNVEFVAKFGSLPQLDPYGRGENFKKSFQLSMMESLR